MLRIRLSIRFAFYIVCCNRCAEMVELVINQFGLCSFYRCGRLGRMGNSFAPQILTPDISDKLRRLPSQGKVAPQHMPLLTQIMHTLSDLRYADDLAQSAKAALVQQQLGVFLTWLSSVYSPQNALPDLPKQRWQAFCALLETHFSTQHQLAFYADALSCHEKTLNQNLPTICGANGKTVH